MPPSVVPEPSGSARPLILFALTDTRVVDVVGGMLREQGHEVRQTADGPATRQALREREPQGVVLSLELPRCDPWQFLQDLRDQARAMPIVVVAPVYIEVDAARAYRSGADDYLTYGISREQGLPRVAARFRRLLPSSGASGPGAGAPGPAGPRGIVVDRATRVARANGTPLDLTPLEFDLLAAFVARPEQVLGQGWLLGEVWGESENADPRRVKYAVLRLRRKIAEATGGRTGIATVRGVGYRYHRID
ncbi:response regulator transcription factor [Streptomyces sp. NPDC004284]|uniref:response regulator transcription factor n=1 Tax=Streptomyces sp. NPDC004284 TaxID=3364695 RepID=UPI0036B25427